MANEPYEAPDRRVDSEPYESREETTVRVLDEIERSDAADPSAGDLTDSSVQRGVPKGIARALAVWGTIGAAVGVVIAVVLMIAVPNTLDVGGPVEVAGYIGLIAVIFAVIVGLIGIFVVLEREDGRVERDVEEATGRSPEQQTPGRPLDPAHDDKA